MSALLWFIGGMIFGAFLALSIAAKWVLKQLPSPEELKELQEHVDKLGEEHRQMALLRKARLL